jgi:hypothetical protein
MAQVQAESRGGVYEITVTGYLGSAWSDLLQEMDIRQVSAGEAPIAVLTGWLPDQAALHGVLTTLHSLSLSIVSVNRLEG